MILTNSQTAAIEAIEKFLNEVVIVSKSSSSYAACVEMFEITEGKYDVTVRARTGYTGLPETNYLRIIGEENFMFFIGKRGKIEVITASKTWRQFAGKKAFGMHFRK